MYKKIIMKKTVNVSIDIKCKKYKTALKRFFLKYSELEDEWREAFELLYLNAKENNMSLQKYSDNTLNDGTHNKYWTHYLLIDQHEEIFYFAIIIREKSVIEIKQINNKYYIEIEIDGDKFINEKYFNSESEAICYINNHNYENKLEKFSKYGKDK